MRETALLTWEYMGLGENYDESYINRRMDCGFYLPESEQGSVAGSCAHGNKHSDLLTNCTTVSFSRKSQLHGFQFSVYTQCDN
jgi:hypothetical protein